MNIREVLKDSLHTALDSCLLKGPAIGYLGAHALNALSLATLNPLVSGIAWTALTVSQTITASFLRALGFTDWNSIKNMPVTVAHSVVSLVACGAAYRAASKLPKKQLILINVSLIAASLLYKGYQKINTEKKIRRKKRTLEVEVMDDHFVAQQKNVRNVATRQQ